MFLSDDFIIWFGIPAYIIFGILVIKYLKRKIKPNNYWSKALIMSFIYALIFGIGIVGGSYSEPGFALPSPILLAGIVDVFIGTDLSIMTNGILIPLLFWWILIFAIMSSINFIKSRKKSTGKQLHNN